MYESQFFVLTLFVLPITGVGHRLLSQTPSNSNHVIVQSSTVAVANGTSYESISINSWDLLDVWDIWNESQQIIPDQETDVTNVFEELLDIYNQGDYTLLGDIFFEVLTQQQNGNESSEAVVQVIETAISLDGCLSISRSLDQMWQLAKDQNKIDQVKQIFEISESMNRCKFQSRVAFNFKRCCFKDYQMSCDWRFMTYVFLMESDNMSCYRAYECDRQGYLTYKECKQSCIS
eukprot:TRINITY_DN1891_c0_g1_i6.p1 TRINITY_DN1891_c0_g1~~TRINITY_DN1891_c0_g1_i6.p1  ORF type:complete len:233 (-),score=9.96 TRINITY_DN1891_c0_g1_i6:1050-1748(-)